MSQRPHRRTAVFVRSAGLPGSSAWLGQPQPTADRECRFLERLTIGDDPEAVVANPSPVPDVTDRVRA